MPFDNLMVIIEVPDATFQADYERKKDMNQYEKFLTTKYLHQRIRVKLIDETYIQLQPIEFTPLEPGNYENVLLIKHKKNFVEEKLSEARRLEEQGLLEEAIELVTDAIQIDPQPRAYNMKVQLIGQMLQISNTVPPQLPNLGEDMKHDEHFGKFSTEFRYKFYLQLGTALLDSKYFTENRRVDSITTCFDLTIRAFDEAIALKGRNAEAYQGKYLAQFRSGFYFDMISTIKQFFKQNPNLTNEQVVKTFLTEWITGIEELTDYPRQTEHEYLQTLRKEPSYWKEWDDVLDVLSEYERFYAKGDTDLNRRLRKAKSLAEGLRQQTKELSGVKPWKRADS